MAASVAGELLGLSLADPSIDFEVVSMRGTVVHAVSRRNLHPLYSCLFLKDPLFGTPTLKPVRGDSAGATATPFFRPAIDDLLNS